MNDICGLSLSYQNSLTPTIGAPMLTTPTHLLFPSPGASYVEDKKSKLSRLPLGIPVAVGAQAQTVLCSTATTTMLISGLSGPDELLFIDVTDQHEITRHSLVGEPSCLAIVGDFIAVFLRDCGAVCLFSLSTFGLLGTLTNLMPAPCVPRFAFAHQNNLIFECAMRVFCLEISVKVQKNIDNKAVSTAKF